MPKISVVSDGQLVHPHVRYPVGAFNEEVTEVPAGEEFEIWAGAQNLVAEGNTWGILITATDGVNIFQYKTVTIYGSGPESVSEQELEYQPGDNPGNPVMPSNDITLRIKLWGNETTGQPLPDTSLW